MLRPVILFLRTADRVAVEGLDSVDGDQAATFEAGSQRMAAAFTTLQLSLADALDDSGLKPDRRKEGEELKALCKELSEQCKVIADNYANALDREKAKQDPSKLEFRGQLQASLGKFATAAGRLDEEVVRTAKAWGVEADKGTPTPDAVATFVVKAEHPNGARAGEQKDNPPGGEWVSLFNGKNLSGWKVDGGDEKNIRVEDGVIVASGSGYQTRSYLLTDRDYANFILRLEFNPERGSGGGIALRAVPGEHLPQDKTPPIFDHPIMKLFYTGNAREETGTLHWIRDVMFVSPDHHAELTPFGSWNQVEIQMRGHSLKVSVNGKVITETTLAEGALFPDGTIPGLNRVKGPLGIQKHHGTIRYRNIEVMELPG